MKCPSDVGGWGLSPTQATRLGFTLRQLGRAAVPPSRLADPRGYTRRPVDDRTQETSTESATGAVSPALLAAAVAVLAFALFARTASLGFTLFDDVYYVAEHPRVLAGLSWASLGWAFTTLHYSNWHPITWISYLLDASVLGARPGAMHLENVLLHAVNSALVLLALFRLTGARWRSAAVAALFAVHPTRVESVAWISERKDLLFTLFGLLALVAYVAYARRPTLWRYLWVALAFAASLSSKAMLVTLPALLLLLDVWPLRRVGPLAHDDGDVPRVGWWRAIREKLPLLALSAGCSALTVVAQYGWKSVIALPFPERLGNGLVAWVRYVGLVVWPVDLAVLYPIVPGGSPAWQVAAAGILLVAASVTAVVLVRRAPWLAVGWFWFLGTLVPVIGVLQVGWQSIADRYTYFPAIGLFLIIAWGADALVRGTARRALTPATAVVLAVLAAASWRQVDHWRDDVALFGHAVEVTGPNPRARTLLALSLLRAGRPAESLEHALEGTRLGPSDERGWMVLGFSERETGHPAEAEAAMREALRIDPTYVEVWMRLATMLRDLGRPEDAIDAYQRYLALNPSDGDTWTQLAILLGGLGRYAQAGAALQAATAADPSNPLAWRNLAAFLVQQGAWAEATRALTRAAALAPGDANVLRQLGHAQVQAGDRAGALATARALAPVDPAGAQELAAMAGGR